MKLILFITPEKKIGLINVGPNQKNILKIAKTDVPSDCQWKIIDASDPILPADSYFRDAWIWQEDKIVVDLEIAKDIKRQDLKKLREPLFSSLDFQYMLALETKNEIKQEEIIAKKQQLRDIPNIALPDDLQALRDFLPDFLKQ